MQQSLHDSPTEVICAPARSLCTPTYSASLHLDTARHSPYGTYEVVEQEAGREQGAPAPHPSNRGGLCSGWSYAVPYSLARRRRRGGSSPCPSGGARRVNRQRKRTPGRSPAVVLGPGGDRRNRTLRRVRHSRPAGGTQANPAGLVRDRRGLVGAEAADGLKVGAWVCWRSWWR
jgi:hypothetical protein